MERPASGVMRHADAGYPDAVSCARERKAEVAERELKPVN
jgi:urocanate hydratase